MEHNGELQAIVYLYLNRSLANYAHSFWCFIYKQFVFCCHTPFFPIIYTKNWKTNMKTITTNRILTQPTGVSYQNDSKQF